MTHTHLDADTLRAKLLQISRCEDGHVHITFKNADGKPIADASLGAEQAIGTAGDIIKAAKEILGEPNGSVS